MERAALPYRHSTAPLAPPPGEATLLPLTRPLNGPRFGSFAIRKPASFGLTRARLRTTAAEAAPAGSGGAPLPALDLTEDNIRQVLTDARVELEQLFDESVGITGEVELCEVDGPFVKISLKGRFWHKRSTVLARVANYLKLRIPEILEVDIEDEKQLDDSPENF